MSVTARASLDPRLRAVVVARRPLLYANGADDALDRPAHVRAGSAIARLGQRLVVVQDDVSFVAVLSPDGAVSALPLPYAPGGARQFEKERGNKQHKLDLEACVTLPDGRLLALGSGSTEVRERVLLARVTDGGDAAAQLLLVHARALYAALRAERSFSGSELNVEGAALLASLGVLRLFQRGNGAAIGEYAPVDASCDVPIDGLLRYLDAPDTTPAPALRDVVRWELGAIDGTRLTFTDAAADAERVFFLAAAEASPNAYDDGPVAGVALGVTDGLAAATHARLAHLTDPSGARFLAKAEGLALDPDDESRAFVVLDLDDPARPSELCTLRLEGPWRGAA